MGAPNTLSFLHKRKMKELKGQDRNDYLLKNARLIFAYYREKKRFYSLNFLGSDGQRYINRYYRQYLYNVFPDLNFPQININKDNYCNDCQI